MFRYRMFPSFFFSTSSFVALKKKKNRLYIVCLGGLTNYESDWEKENPNNEGHIDQKGETELVQSELPVFECQSG